MFRPKSLGESVTLRLPLYVITGNVPDIHVTERPEDYCQCRLSLVK